MIKIIERGVIEKLKNDFPRERRCKKCFCLFTFDAEDIIDDKKVLGYTVKRTYYDECRYPYVACPECGILTDGRSKKYPMEPFKNSLAGI